MARLKTVGVPTAIYYRTTLQLQPAYSYLEYKEGGFPFAEEFGSRILSLPMHPYPKLDEINHVAEVLRNVINA